MDSRPSMVELWPHLPRETRIELIVIAGIWFLLAIGIFTSFIVRIIT